jgi:tripartite-type tricarboxylate transporter receptor subunit TctC
MSHLSIRPVLGLAIAIAGALLAFTAIAPATASAAGDAYPQRTVTLVVPSPAGGTTDVIARIVARKLTTSLGQSFIVENRSGANGYIGTMAVLRAPKDGYMLIVMSGSLHSFTPNMVEKMPFNPIDDFLPITRLIAYPYILVTPPTSDYHSFQQLIDAGRKPDSKLAYGSYGVGSAPHLITELFKLKTGVAAIHVPYKGGGQSASDLMGGQISMMFSSLPAATAQIQSGQIKALAITSAKRYAIFPNVPAVAEFIPGFEATSWIGLGAAAGTPQNVADTIRNALQKATSDPEFVKQVDALGAQLLIDKSSEDFHRYLVSEKAKWKEVVSAAHIPIQPQ